MGSNRYNDYYLVNDEDMDIEDSIEFRTKKKCSVLRIISFMLIGIVLLTIIAIILLFVGFPLVFMTNVTLQQNLVFTHWNLETSKSFFENFRFPGFKNHYVTVKDIDNETELELGLWHILPLELAQNALSDDSYDYDAALKSSAYNVLLYFHGTGEDRSQSERKYQALRLLFHVVAFDYRSYGDSTGGELFENNVVNDCVQVFKWLQNRTDSPIFVWGHSLGTALATRTVAQLSGEYNTSGLILEAPFTTFKEELYHHPIVKYFKWLPWFEATIVRPLEANGFIFNTSGHILDVDCALMFLHARDDRVVPSFMSEKLYEISEGRNIDVTIKNQTMLILFDKRLRLNHYFIYQDPYLIFDLFDFMIAVGNSDKGVHFYKGSHQS